ncbi:MAG TPA: GTP pyrophosphokinase [Desulfobacterales bacterium]|nr:GTP pyrophosphokinase [Desulfobacterales bacterium]
MSILEKAILIAVQAHQGQVDKAGVPYILHPLRVLLKLNSETEMIIGVLHDVVEDTTWTLESLKQEGFPTEILEAIDCLTRREGEDYNDFIKRVAGNPLARKVKMRDLEDNMNILRLETITEKDKARLSRYHEAWITLTNEE